MPNFVDDSVPTMLKTPRFPAWRPDKVVMQQTLPPSGPCIIKKPTWKCVSTEVLGAEARPLYAERGE